MFIDELTDRIRRLQTPLCVGLDPTLELMPASFLRSRGLDRSATDATACAEALYAYCLDVLEAVGDLVPVVKPQSAYFEVYGAAGIRSLERTIAAARERGLLVVLDAKRGDIGSTSEAYARAYLAGHPPRDLEVDALTVSPYLGEDSLEPFFATAAKWGKGLLVCARTSNPGAASIQDQLLGDLHVYEVVADWVAPMVASSTGACGYSGLGIVVGATAEEQARRLRRRLPRSLFLVPGLGVQGGGMAAVRACLNEDGLGAIVNVSRAAIYPHLQDPQRHGGVADVRATVQGLVADLRAGLR